MRRFRGELFTNPVFLQRCKAPLVKFLGQDPEDDPVRGEEWQGENLELMGDVGVRVRSCRGVPLGLVLWRGDAEFPAGGKRAF